MTLRAHISAETWEGQGEFRNDHWLVRSLTLIAVRPGVRIAILCNDFEHQRPEDPCIVNKTLRFARRDWLTTDRINQMWITTFKEVVSAVKGLRKLRASSSHA